MTTIAYRDGVMAADSRAYIGQGHALGAKIKVRRLSDGRLVGCSTGDVGVPDAVLDWYADGMSGGSQALKDKLPLVKDVGFQLLAVSRDGVGTFINGYGLPTSAKAAYYAIGSGEDFALGALEAGKSAPEAVAIACRFDTCSDTPVFAATHDNDPSEYGPLRQAE